MNRTKILSFTLALVIVVLNLLAIHKIGIAYSSYSWKKLAVYYPPQPEGFMLYLPDIYR
ncbi:MAG TPA: hypothetical protein VLA49_21820 [Anaerolineales bacterium]|nr:hypothetical protein [Anaerolineales bacterium]